MQTQGNKTQAGMWIIDGCLADEIAAETGLSAQQVRARLSIFQNRRVLMTRHATRRKQQLFRFGIRSLLVVMVVLCLPLAYMGWRLERGNRQREAVEWVRSYGGVVKYDFELENRKQIVVEGTWLGQFEWAKRNLDVDFFARVHSVELAGKTDVTDLSPLIGIDHLTRLDLNGVAAVDISPLSQFSKLEELDLSGMAVRDLAPLTELHSLKRLRMCGTVTGVNPADEHAGAREAWLHLGELQGLEELDLRAANVSDLSPVAALVSLKRLHLACTFVADLGPLSGLSKLEELDLSSCNRVNDLRPLRNATALKRLDLYRTDVSDISPLAGLIKLERLDVSETPVTDLSPLCRLTKVQMQHVSKRSTPANRSTSAGPETIPEFSRSLDDCGLIIGIWELKAVNQDGVLRVVEKGNRIRYDIGTTQITIHMPRSTFCKEAVPTKVEEYRLSRQSKTFHRSYGQQGVHMKYVYELTPHELKLCRFAAEGRALSERPSEFRTGVGTVVGVWKRVN